MGKGMTVKSVPRAGILRDPLPGTAAKSHKQYTS